MEARSAVIRVSLSTDGLYPHFAALHAGYALRACWLTALTLMMRFEIVGEISEIETFAIGSGIREIARLRRAYGRGRGRKRKGVVRVRFGGGSVHWYEAAGIGRKEFKIKRLL